MLFTFLKNSTKRKSRCFSKLAIVVMLASLSACSKSQEKEADSREQAQSEVNLNAQTAVKHAKGFKLSYTNRYKVLDIVNGPDTLQYLLLPGGATKPAGFEKAQIIRIPVKSLVALSSTHIALLQFLDSEDVLTGLDNLQYVFSPKVIQMIEGGKVVSVGKNPGLNEEKLIEMHPDLIMAVGSPGAKADQYRTLREAGIPVLINSEWIENTPLGRAEWVKVAAALLDKEELVNQKFEKIEKEYAMLSDLAKSAEKRPVVISGLNTKDAWFMPGGNGYMAQFLKDAGADYPWSNQNASGSIPLSFESVYPFALKADYWVNVGFDRNDSKASILAQDNRYADFNAFKSGKIYSYNNRVNARNSNDFFESGIVSPEVILADLIHIFHPELLPDHKLVYYKMLK